MAEYEELGAFKRNLKALTAAIANERLDIVHELGKVDSWIRWVDDGPGVHPACTHGHQDHLRIVASLDIARALVRRRYAEPERELPAVKRHLEWALALCECNLGNGLDTDKLMCAILDPSAPLYTLHDPVPPPGAQEAQSAAGEAGQGAAAQSDSGDAPPAHPPLTAAQSASSDMAAALAISFAEQLRPGDECDFRLEDGAWTRARVVMLSETETELNLEDLSTGAKDHWISIEEHADRVAAAGTKAGANTAAAPASSGTEGGPSGPALVTDADVLRARAELTVGTLIDAQDKSGRWLQACIVDTRPAAAPVSDAATGPPEQDEGVRPESLADVRITFLGLAGKFDEWLPLASRRIEHRLNWRSGGRRGGSLEVAFECEQERDLPPGEPEFLELQTAAAVQRKYTYSSLRKGPLYISLLNYFLMQNSYSAAKALRKRIAPDAPRPNTLSWVADVTTMLGRNADVLTKHIVSFLLVPWVEYVRAYVESLDDDVLRGVSNIREAAEAITLGLRRIIRRTSSDRTEAGRVAELTLLNLIRKCCSSSQVMKRRDGLKMLSDVRMLAYQRTAHPNGVWPIRLSNGTLEYMRVDVASHVTNDILAEWIQSASIFKDVFVKRHHRELVRMSGDVVRVLVAAGRLSDEHVEDVWTALNMSAADDVDATISLLCEVATDLPAAVHATILRRLTRLATFVPAHVKLLAAAARFQPLTPAPAAADDAVAVANAGVVHAAIAALFALSMGVRPAAASTRDAAESPTTPEPAGASASRAELPQDVMDAAKTAFLNALQHSALAALRMPYMKLCLRCIAGNICVTRAMTALQGIIDTYPSTRPRAPVVLPASANLLPTATAAVAVTLQSTPLPAPADGLVVAANIPDTDRCTADVIHLLHHAHGLVDVLLTNISAYCGAARSRASTIGLPMWYRVLQRKLAASGGAAATPAPAESKLAETSAGTDAKLQEESDIAIDGLSPADLVDTFSTLDDAEVTVLSDAAASDATAERADRDVVAAAEAALRAAPDSITTGGSAFAAGVKARLTFLAHVLSSSELLLSRSQSASLFHECVGMAVTPSQRGAALQWFTNGVAALARAEGSTAPNVRVASQSTVNLVDVEPLAPATAAVPGVCFGPDSVVSLFMEHINTSAFIFGPALDAPAFTAWRTFFMYVNGKAGKLLHSGMNLPTLGSATDAGGAFSPSTSSAAASAGAAAGADSATSSNAADRDAGSTAPSAPVDGGFRVVSFDLLGLDSLWHVTLHAEDAEVAAAAVTLLTSLQQRLADTLLPRLAEFRRRYIQRCVSFIREAAVSAGLLSSEAAHAGSVSWPWTAASAADTSAVAGLSRAVSDPALHAGATARADHLIERCIALLDSLLDEAEEEAFTVRRELQMLRDDAADESATASVAPAEGEEFRAALRAAEHALAHGSHARDAAQLVSGGAAGAAVEDAMTLRLTFNVKVYDFDAPCSAGLTESKAEAPGQTRLRSASSSSDGTTESSDTVEIKEVSDAQVGAATGRSAWTKSADGGAAQAGGKDASDAGKSNDWPVKRSVRADDVRIRFSRNEPLAALRSLVADALDIHFRTFRIVIPPASLSSAEAARGSADPKPREVRAHVLGRTPAEIGLRDGAILMVLSRPPPDRKKAGAALSAARGTAQPQGESATPAPALSPRQKLTAAIERHAHLPASLLASDASAMSLLLSLVDAGTEAASGTNSQVAQKAWRLLCRLPTQPHYLKAVLGLATSRESPADTWTRVLPAESRARLLYGCLLLRRMLSPSDRAADWLLPARARVIRRLTGAGAGKAALLFAMSQPDVTPGTEASSIPEPASAQAAPASAGVWRRAFVTSGGLPHVRSMLTHLLAPERAATLLPEHASPLTLSVTSFLLQLYYGFCTTAISAHSPAARAMRATASAATTTESGDGEVLFAKLDVPATHALAWRFLTTALLSTRLANISPSAIRSLVLPAMLLWGMLCVADASLWSQTLASGQVEAIVLEALLPGDAAQGGSAPPAMDSALSALRCAAAVVLYDVATLVACGSGKGSAVLEAVTPEGAEHPHAFLLRTLLRRRPRHGELSPQQVRASVVFTTLLEVLLRESLRAYSSGGSGDAQTPPELLRFVFDLVQQLRTCPVTETQLSASSSSGPLETMASAASAAAAAAAAAAASAAAETSQPAVSAPPSLTDAPVAAYQSIFTSIRRQQLAPLHGTFTVAPMHPAFATLGSPTALPRADGGAWLLSPAAMPALPAPGSAAASASATPSGSPAAVTAASAVAGSLAPLVRGVPVLPSPSAVAALSPAGAATSDSVVAAVAGVHAVNNFSGEHVVADDEPTAAVPGVDLILLMTLRLLTAVAEADPGVAAALGGSRELNLIPFLYHDCLFDLPRLEFGAAAVPGAVVTLPTPPAVPGGKPAAPQTAVQLVAVTSPERRAPKCKTLMTRKAAMSLLTALTRRCTGNVQLLGAILRNECESMYDDPLSRFNMPGWRQNPAGRDMVSPLGYVGLRNLGCICYMNALMQQFYMIEPFRYAVLSVPVGERMSDVERKDNVLYQLQRMFGYLELSTRKHYSPESWTAAYKDFDGNPTNPMIQQDAQEYLTTFLDRVEFALKGSARAPVIQQVLGLQLREARYCTGGCGTIRTSTEPQVCLSVPVSQGSMAASLESYVAWEDIPDYNCETCKARTTLRKRNTIGALGNTLIVHLKRFEMNYETGMPTKLNNRFEFPTELDLYPQSYQALVGAGSSTAPSTSPSAAGAEEPPCHPREYYQYELVGVVVHTGTLESGHYYSYIRERGRRAAVKAMERDAAMGNAASVSMEAAASGRWAGRWMEFNDSLVTDFDPAKIPEECFGGTTTATTYNTLLKQHISTEVPVMKNAYMLVYERKQPQAIEVEVDPEEAVAIESACAAASIAASSPGAAAVPVGDAAATGRDAGSPASSTALPAPSAAPAAPGQGSTAPGATVHTTGRRRMRLFPHQLVPFDRHGRGPLPASIAEEVAVDNVAFLRVCQAIDVDFAMFMHVFGDTIARNPALLPASASKRVAPESPAAVAIQDEVAQRSRVLAALRGTAVSPADATAPPPPGRPVTLPDIIRALFMYCFYPLAKAAHMHLVPHYAYTLCRLYGVSLEAARALLESIVKPTPAGHDILRDALFRCPQTTVRASLARVLLAALMKVSLDGQDAGHAQKRPVVDVLRVDPATGHGVIISEPAKLPAAYVCTLDIFLHSVLTSDFMDTTIGPNWKTFDQFFGVLYDLSRFGYGCGLPLTVQDALMHPASDASMRACTAALTAWTAGDSYPTSRTPWRNVPSDAGEVLWQQLQAASRRLRSLFIAHDVPLRVLDLYMGSRSTAKLSDKTPRKRTIMGTKTATPVWTRAFDLVALLVRTMFVQAQSELGGAPPTSVVLGPVPAQRHGVPADVPLAVALLGPLPAPNAGAAPFAATAPINDVQEAAAAWARAAAADQAAGVPVDAEPGKELHAEGSCVMVALPAWESLLPPPSSDDEAIIQRSIAAANDYLRKHYRPWFVALESGRSVTVGAERIVDPARLPMHRAYEVDTRRENMYQGLIHAKYQVFDPKVREGFTLEDVYWDDDACHLRKCLLSSVLVKFLLGVDDEVIPEQHFPGNLGPNPEAVMQIFAHMMFYCRPLTNRLVKELTHALERADFDNIRGLALLAEGFTAVRDQFAWSRRIHPLATELTRLWTETRSKIVDFAFEYLNTLLRLSILHPKLGDMLASNADLAASVESWLREVEADPKEGYGKASAWLAAAVDAERRPELAAAAAAGGTGAAPANDAGIAYKQHLVSLVVGPVTRCSAHDELTAVQAVPLTLSLRATIALQRLRRILEARDRKLLGPVELARRTAAARAAAAGAASSASGGSAADVGGQEVAAATEGRALLRDAAVPGNPAHAGEA